MLVRNARVRVAVCAARTAASQRPAIVPRLSSFATNAAEEERADWYVHPGHQAPPIPGEEQQPSGFQTYLNRLKRRGLKDAVWSSFVFSDFRSGDLVGEDDFGHKYYEDKSAPHPRHRWVEYPGNTSGTISNNFGLDPTGIPAVWHSWLHHLTGFVLRPSFLPPPAPSLFWS
jgi:NADH ubiquinone oxidoreductase subunit NDUFA12